MSSRPTSYRRYKSREIFIQLNIGGALIDRCGWRIFIVVSNFVIYLVISLRRVLRTVFRFVEIVLVDCKDRVLIPLDFVV